MKSLSLTQRLTLIFAIILIICTVMTIWLYYQNRTRYTDAMIQNLSRGLSELIVSNEELINSNGADRKNLQVLFSRMMDYNPSVEVYLIDPSGNILADAVPASEIRDDSIDLNPIMQFIQGHPTPIYGDDPRSLDKKKVFSAAPVIYHGETAGYLYIILQGENYNQLALNALTAILKSAMIWSVAIILLCGLTAGAFAFYLVTRPIRKLTELVAPGDERSQNSIQRLAQLSYPAQQDEVAQLETAFISMARRIACQWENLEQKEQQRREFVANISHDLRTPLMSIQGYLETLCVKNESLSPVDRYRYLRIALDQSVKVGKLAQQLFELARLEHGVVTPHYEKFCVTDLVQDVLQKFELVAEQRKLRTDIQIESNLPQLVADMSMVERVLTNLIDNASRYTPEEGTIQLRVWKQDKRMIMECQDSGPGISAECHETLFERPSFTDSSSRHNGGLGLILVRRMLQLHGGDIRLLPTKGACFRFWLPLEPHVNFKKNCRV